MPKFNVVLYYGNKDHTWHETNSIEVEIEDWEYENMLQSEYEGDPQISVTVYTLACNIANFTEGFDPVFITLGHYERIDENEGRGSGGYGTKGYSEASGVWN